MKRISSVLILTIVGTTSFFGCQKAQTVSSVKETDQMECALDGNANSISDAEDNAALEAAATVVSTPESCSSEDGGYTFVSGDLPNDILLSSLAQDHIASNLSLAITVPKRGVDIASCGPVSANFKVLVTNEKRIKVPANASLDDIKRGSDVPTDARDILATKVLVVDNIRAQLNIVQARAGVDYPTDLPIPEHNARKSFSVLIVGNSRIALSNIVKIEQAKAGVDYPTCGPLSGRNNHLIVVTSEGTRIQL